MADLNPGWQTVPVDAGRGVDCFVVRGSESGPTVAVTAGIHGDEYEGIAAVQDLCAGLDAGAVRGTLILIPVANPTAYAAGTRTNPEDGRNLARSFPGRADGQPTEVLAAKVFELVGEADYLIDLHSGGVEYLFLPVAGFYGKVSMKNASFAAAARFGMDALWRLPPTPGVLSYEMHRRGACVVGCEYLGAGQLSPVGRSRYRQGIEACLGEWGILPDSFPAQSPAPAFTGDWLLAQADGLFEARATLGQSVEAGAELAVVTSIRGETLQRFVAGVAGTVLAMRSKGYIRVGQWGVLLGLAAEVSRG